MSKKPTSSSRREELPASLPSDVSNVHRDQRARRRQWTDLPSMLASQRSAASSSSSSSSSSLSASAVDNSMLDDMLESVRRQPHNEHFDVSDQSSSNDHSPNMIPSLPSSSSSSSSLSASADNVASLLSSHRESASSIISSLHDDVRRQSSGRSLIHSSSSPSSMSLSDATRAGPSQPPPRSSPRPLTSSSIEQQMNVVAAKFSEAMRRTPRQPVQQQQQGEPSHEQHEQEEDEERDAFNAADIPVAHDVESSSSNSQSTRTTTSVPKPNDSRYITPSSSSSMLTHPSNMSTIARHADTSSYSSLATPDPGARSATQDALMRQMNEIRAMMEEMRAEKRKTERENAELKKQLQQQQQHEQQMKNEENKRVMNDEGGLNRKKPTEPPTLKLEATRRSDEKTKARVKSESGSNHPFPSLSPTASPSLDMGRRMPMGSPLPKAKLSPSSSSLNMKKDEQDDDGEEKYDAQVDEKHKKKTQKMGDLPTASELDEDELPLSDDEAAVLEYDRKPDSLIKMPEGRGEDHLRNFPMWTYKREKLFPFANPCNARLYARRFTLMSGRGRHNEYLRTGAIVNFLPELFGAVVRRWWEAVMANHGVALKDAPKRPLRASKATFQLPEMAYDDRDEVHLEAEFDEHDLNEMSHTFGPLPEALRRHPPLHEQAQPHELTVQEFAVRHAKQMKRMQMARQPASPGDEPPSDDSEDDDYDNEHRGRLCPRCKTERVYGADWKKMCHQCTKLTAEEKEARLRRSMPKLDADPLSAFEGYLKPEIAESPSSSPTSSSSSSAAAGGHTSYRLSVGGSSVSLDPYGSSSSPATIVKSESGPLNGRDQERALMLQKEEANARKRQGVTTSEDAREQAECVLGDILSYVIPPEERAMMRMLVVDGDLTFRDRLAAIEKSALLMGKFNGATMDAPGYLRRYCEQVVQYRYNQRDAHSLLTKTMVGAAATWLETNMSDVFQLGVTGKPLELLMHRFREMYIGPHYAREVRHKLYTTKMKTPNPSREDLDTHYNTFTKLVQQLKFIDRAVSEKELITDFYSSLPPNVQLYIGSDFAAASSYHDLQRKAQQCLILMPSRAPVRQDGALPATIGVNAMPTGNNNNRPKSKSDATPRTTTQFDKRQAMCYWCGEKGHWTGRCPLIDQKQTAKGARMWAERNQSRGIQYTIDKQWYIDRADRAEREEQGASKGNKQRSSSSSSSSSSQSSRSKKKDRPRTTVDLSSSSKSDAIRLDSSDVDDDGEEH